MTTSGEADRHFCCLQSKEEIAQDVKEQLEKSMTAFGFSIIQTLVSCQEQYESIDSLSCKSSAPPQTDCDYDVTACLAGLQVTDIEPDARVRVAMNEINAASRMR